MAVTSSIVAVALFILSIQAQIDFSVTTSNISTWDQSGWSLTANKYIPGQYQSRMSLGNGYIGASLAAAGPFFEIDINETDANGLQPTNGWPIFKPRISFSTISGFYDVQPGFDLPDTNYPWLNQYGWESFISGIPHPTSIIFAFGDSYLDATVSNTSISNFASKISFKTGLGEWSYRWNPESCSVEFDIHYEVAFSRKRPNVIAVKASITPTGDVEATVTDLLDGRSAVRTVLAGKGMDVNGSTIYSSVHPSGLSEVTGYVVSGVDFSNSYTDLSTRTAASGSYVSTNETTIGQTFNISLKCGETATFYKYVGIASTDKFADAGGVARQAQQAAQGDGWEVMLPEHISTWAEIMTEDSVDNFTDPVTGQLPDDQNIEILQIASVANTFYLLQNLQPDGSGLNDNSIAVGGLASDSYAGLIFWDADYWMAPGLNLASPDWSKQISNFRLKQHSQALENAAFNNFPDGSALYSWTAGRYGNCTGTGPCVDYEYHLNYDIAFNLFQQYNITKNETWLNNGPRQVIESAAIMTEHLLQYNDTTKSYWLHNMTDPDEYANNVDNGAFTIASASQLLRYANDLRVVEGMEVNEMWKDQEMGIEFPVAESNITLEYQGMNNSVQVKQADVVLLSYHLGYEEGYDEAHKLLDLDYYANKQSPNGPAMTYSIFSINANTLSPSGCSAYTYTLNGMLPYLRAPFYQFSEQANDNYLTNGHTNPAFPFLTGNGGANQIIPFGYLGLRTDLPSLYINPSLPPQLSYLKVRTFYYAGVAFSATMNQTHTNLTRLAGPTNKVLNNTSSQLAILHGSESLTISESQTLTLPNRLYHQNTTYSHNILQCAPLLSTSSPYQPGQFPLAAIDGATSTVWQPSTNTSASITVDTSSISPIPITLIYFDWGARPPSSAIVFLSNSSFSEDNDVGGDGGEVKRIEIKGIEINQPFNQEEGTAGGEEVVPVKGNTTQMDVSGLGFWSGRFARLEIEGCWTGDGVGATVGEWVLVGA